MVDQGRVRSKIRGFDSLLTAPMDWTSHSTLSRHHMRSEKPQVLPCRKKERDITSAPQTLQVAQSSCTRGDFC